MKQPTLINFSLLSSLLFLQFAVQAQMVGVDAYVQGVNMEMGIKGVGGFEGVDAIGSPPPVGMHMRSSNSLFGIVGNPQKNSWTTFDGDYFTPGSPENGWGFEIDTAGGVNQANNCSWLQQINGNITSWSHLGGYFSVDWEGDCISGTDLHFKINYKLQDTALFYTTTVSITNNTSASIPDMYFYKNIDADNNQEISADFTTQNTIVSQPSGGGGTAYVSCTSMVPWYSHLALIGLGADWRANYGGFSNRDASNMWYGTGFTQTIGATNFADEAMSLAYRIQNFLPATTRTFQYLTVIDTNALEDALISTLFLDFPGEDNNSSFIPDTLKICGTDSVSINVSGPTVYDYNWTWSPSTGLSDSTGTSVLVFPTTQTTYTVVGTPISGIGSNDTMLIVAEAFSIVGLVANISSLGTVCYDATPFVLTAGSPLGGIYSGDGVWGGNMYDPSFISVGPHVITYTVSDSNGCSVSDSTIVIIDQVIVSHPYLGTFCNNVPPFVMTGGSPLGGIYSGPGVFNDSVFVPSSVAPGSLYSITYTYTDSAGCSASVVPYIYITNCTGIVTNNINNNCSVYPNPFTDETLFAIGNTLQLRNTNLHVYDILGKEVMQISDIQNHQFILERKNLQSGIYFYKLLNDSEIIGFGKLIIK